MQISTSKPIKMFYITVENSLQMYAVNDGSGIPYVKYSADSEFHPLDGYNIVSWTDKLITFNQYFSSKYHFTFGGYGIVDND